MVPGKITGPLASEVKTLDPRVSLALRRNTPNRQLVSLPFSGCFHLNLVVQFHSKLDLPRIVWSKTSGPDFAEVSAVEVI
jgi:hypothetical protein